MPKKELPEYVQKLKSQLETSNNLIDYFLLCGIPPIACKQKYLYDIKSPTYLDTLKSQLKPKILSKFPDFDISTNTIDDEILKYIFPNGFEPIYSNTVVPPKTYSIILDNNLFSSDNPQKYLTCLLFYEPVSKYKKLQLNIENRNPTPKDLYDEEELKNKNDNNKFVRKNNLMNSLYDLGDIPDDNIKQLKLGNFYIPKCICLVSIHPYIKLFEKILSNVYTYSTKTERVGTNIPLEKIITNLIIEVPVSPRGLYSIQYILTDESFTFTNIENNRLQIAEISLRKINKKLGLETIIEGLKHIILGSKVLIFGSELNLISESILAFLYLLFPFKYPFQIISYLNKDNYNILESISPFIIGINEPYYDNFFIDKEIAIDGMEIFVIDLDKKTSFELFYETFPNFPKKLVENLEKEIRLLEEKFKRAKFEDSGRRSVSTVNITRINKNSSKKEEKFITVKDYNEHYQYYFFYFFCQILKHYEKYLNMDYFKSNDSDKVTSIDTLFNCKKFIDSHGENEISFYTKFVEESQLFADFIYKRMIPRNSQEIIDVLLVNETIISIKNRSRFIGSQKTEFLESNAYKILSKYVVPKARTANKEEMNFLKNKINEYKNKGQIIMSIKYKCNNYDMGGFGTKNDNINNSYFLKNMKSKIEKELNINEPKKEEIKEELYFQYFIFPELDFKLYCNEKNINEYYFPPDYSEEIETVNIQCISKSSIGQTINQNLEMRNHIYLTWLEIWAYTFHYSEKIEREYRFNQMLDILDKVIHHEINILNLLFETLNEERESIMIFKLYQKLLQLKINPNTVIYNIISNILDKDKIKETIEENKNNPNIKSLKFEIDSKIKSNFKERTFLSKTDKLLLSSKMKFDIIFPCAENCEEKINLFKVCQNYENISNDTEWVPCAKGHYNLPIIKVKFGFELFPSLKEKKSKKNLSTCTTNEIVLHSPYNLKINIYDVANKYYNNKLKLESFKNEFNPLFWGFIWYCNIHNLDYSIILPYLNRIEQLNEIRYTEPNKEVLQISFNNKLYKRNENVIYDIRSNKSISNNDNTKKGNIIKIFKLLVIKKEISIQFGKVVKDRNNKNMSFYFNHLNPNENFRIPSTNAMTKQDIKQIMNKFQKIETKVKKDTSSKFPDISLENSRRDNNLALFPKGSSNITSLTEFMLKRKEVNTKNKK